MTQQEEMKYIDFDQERIHFVVDKENGRYLGHVSTASLDNCNTIFAAYVAGHGRGQGILKKSLDAAKTWSNRLPVPESWSTLLQVPTIYSIKQSNNRDRLLYFTGHYPIRYSLSDDNGENWTELEAIGEFGGNVSMASLMQLSDGSLLGFFHDDGRYLTFKKDLRYELYRIGNNKDECILFYRDQYVDQKIKLALDSSTLKTGFEHYIAGRQCIYKSSAGEKCDGLYSDIYMTRSYDFGRTWQYPVKITENNKLSLAEPCAFYSPDKNQICVIMREELRKISSYFMTSNDGGSSWTEPSELPSALNGIRHVAKYLPNSKLMISFGSRYNGYYPNDWVAWIGDYDSLQSGSDDGDYLIRIKENKTNRDWGYSGLEIKDNGQIISVNYGMWGIDERPYILAAAFNPIERFYRGK